MDGKCFKINGNLNKRLDRIEGIISSSKPRSIRDYSDSELEQIIFEAEGCIPSDERLLEIAKRGHNIDKKPDPAQ